MIPDNDWYGHKYILSLYCGHLQPPAIFGSLMHGWRSEMDGSGHRRLTSAPLLVWNELLAAEAKQNGVPNTRSIGAPFLYLIDLLGRGSLRTPPGRGTLCFPYHSAGELRVDRNHRRFVEHVEATETGPFTASLFYQDINRPGFRDPFDEAGWRIVCCGTRDDPLFLFRLYAEILSHEVVLADQLGSSIWYAGALGRRIRIVPATPTMSRSGENEELADFVSTFPMLHGAGLDQRAARDEAYIQLGYSSMLNPTDLSGILGWNSSKRFYASVLGKVIDHRRAPGARGGKDL